MKRLLCLVAVLLAGSAQAQVVTFPPSGGSAAAAGQPVSGCTAYSLVYIDSAGNLQCAQAPQNGSTTTAGTSTIKWLSTISGSSTTSNWLNVTGTFPATLSAATSAIYATVAFDNDSQQQAVVRSIATGTGPAANWGAAVWGDSQIASAQGSAAGYFTATGASGTSVGVWGNTTAGTRQFGGYFSLGSLGVPSSGTSALVADNGPVAANIFEARDNGTAVFTIADGGLSNFATDVGLYFGSQTNAFPRWLFNSAMTPDAMMLGAGSTANALHVVESSDIGSDFNNGRCATSACTDPSLIVHSHNQATNQYLQLSNDATLAHVDGQAGTNGAGQFAFAGAKDLTESSATVVVDIPVASGAYTGATINWTVVASDGTDHQSRRGSTYLAVVNKAGTETCSVGDVGTTVVAVSAGTLTATTGQDTTGSNVCTFTINAVSSLTQTTLRAHYSVIMDGPGIPAAR